MNPKFLNYKFAISQSISKNLFNFAIQFGRLSNISDNHFFRIIKEENLKKSSLSAVSIDKQIIEKTDLENLNNTHLAKLFSKELKNEFINYTNAKLEIALKAIQIDLKLIHQLADEITGQDKTKYRKNKKILPKLINSNTVARQINLEIKTPVKSIKEKLIKLIEEINSNLGTENPLILAGLAHFFIAEIHPFEDGNGRLGRLIEYSILKISNLDISEYCSSETYYLRNRDRYYQIIEDAIESKNLTEWLEFYCEALLSTILENTEKLASISSGAVDLKHNKLVDLSPTEQKIIDEMRQKELPSPTEMAKKLNMSRQNVFYILRNLHKKGIITKVGKNTAARYLLKTSSVN